MKQEIFESAPRSTGDLAGVFEYDGEAGYFYLYDVSRNEGQKIVASIHIVSGATDFTGTDVTVQWDTSEDRVGIFIRDALWAVFNIARRTTYGGNYEAGGRPTIPQGEAFPIKRKSEETGLE